MIDKVTFLNLEHRTDRKLVAYCNAIRSGVPEDKIDFWRGNHFASLDALGRDAVEKGIEHFQRYVGNKNPVSGTPIGYNYNMMQYLMDRVKRGTIEILMHDDAYLICNLITSGLPFPRLEHIVHTIFVFAEEMNLLVLSPDYVCSEYRELNLPDIEYLTPGSIIAKGIRSTCDYGWVLSQKGAQAVLDKMLALPPSRPVEMYQVPLGTSDEIWNPEGSWTLTVPFVKRLPTSILGSDNFKNSPPRQIF